MIYRRSGFTLIELIIYIGMFAGAAFLLTGILTTILRVQSRGVVTNEVSAQANFALEAMSRHVRGSSVIEKVYEGTNESSPCIKYCSVKLRMSDPSLDPTIISSDADAIYIKQGTGLASAITNTKVIVNNLNFRKNEAKRAHTVLDIDFSLQYNSTDSRSFAVKSLKSAIGRVSAVTFDDHLLPGADALSDVGQSSGSRWRNGWFSGDFVIEGMLGVGTAGANPAGTRLYVPGPDYLQFGKNGAGVPLSNDCNEDAERGRFYIDTSSNRLYICNGATRGWDYVSLTN